MLALKRVVNVIGGGAHVTRHELVVAIALVYVDVIFQSLGVYVIAVGTLGRRCPRQTYLVAHVGGLASRRGCGHVLANVDLAFCAHAVARCVHGKQRVGVETVRHLCVGIDIAERLSCLRSVEGLYELAVAQQTHLRDRSKGVVLKVVCGGGEAYRCLLCSLVGGGHREGLHAVWGLKNGTFYYKDVVKTRREAAKAASVVERKAIFACRAVAHISLVFSKRACALYGGIADERFICAVVVVLAHEHVNHVLMAFFHPLVVILCSVAERLVSHGVQAVGFKLHLGRYEPVVGVDANVAVDVDVVVDDVIGIIVAAIDLFVPCAFAPVHVLHRHGVDASSRVEGLFVDGVGLLCLLRLYG